jgi:hypothetical protein
VFHVLSVKPADAPAADAVASASEQWLRQLSSADQASYVQWLRQRFGAKVVRGELAAPAKDESQ